MKTFAQINENNIVVNICVAADDWEEPGWIEYTDVNPAFINGDYVEGYFYPEKPEGDWVRNEGNWDVVP